MKTTRAELYGSFPSLGKAMGYRTRWIRSHPGQPKPVVRKRATYRQDLWRVFAGTGDIPARDMNLATGRKNWWLR